jgi:hypothetical protein
MGVTINYLGSQSLATTVHTEATTAVSTDGTIQDATITGNANIPKSY